MEDIRKIVGRNVRTLREERGFSQEELSFECSLHRTYVSGIERGVRNPTVLIVEKIAVSLGVAAERLLVRNTTGESSHKKNVAKR